MTEGMLAELTGGDAQAWATAPLHGLERVLLPRVDTGCLTPPPAGRNSADGIGLLLALHRIVDIDGTFADLRHVLRPGGTLVVVVPSVAVRSLADLRWQAVLRPVRHGPWLHRAALDNASWLLVAADFAVLDDDRVPFTLPLPDGEAARRAVDALPAAGLWPHLPVEIRAELVAALVARAGPGCELPVPLRRLVARR